MKNSKHADSRRIQKFYKGKSIGIRENVRK